MKRSWLGLLAACVISCGGRGSSRPSAPPAPIGQASPVASVFDGARIGAELDRYLDALGSLTPLSGYLHVATESGPLYSRAFGFADWASQRPVTAETRFRVGSVTKQFTAAAIMRLLERGQVALDASIRTYLPAYPAATGDRITVRQLLMHRAGLPNMTDDEEFMRTRATARTPRELLEVFWSRPLDFEPGAAFRYSNSGYVVLGAIIEAVSGASLAAFMQRELFEPAGLVATTIGDGAADGTLATGYKLVGGSERVAADPIDMSIPFAAGAVTSTAADLARWHEALLGDRVLTAASRATLLGLDDPAVVPADGKSHYALGWEVTRGERITAQHDGGIDGFLTSYVRVLEPPVVIVAWTNVPNGDFSAISRTALDVLFGGEAVLPATIAAEHRGRLVGAYVISDESRSMVTAMGLPREVIASIETIELFAQGPFLMLEPVGQAAVRLAPEADGSLSAVSIGAVVRPEFDAATGKAVGFEIKQGLLPLRYRRAP